MEDFDNTAMEEECHTVTGGSTGGRKPHSGLNYLWTLKVECCKFKINVSILCFSLKLKSLDFIRKVSKLIY